MDGWMDTERDRERERGVYDKRYVCILRRLRHRMSPSACVFGKASHEFV